MAKIKNEEIKVVVMNPERTPFMEEKLTRDEKILLSTKGYNPKHF